MESFFEKVDITSTDGCWRWVGCMSQNRYGRFTYNGKTMNAHRVSWLILVGEIPDSMEVDHICHNRECVNPDHLRLATHAQNGQNRKINSDNTSGFKGVYWSKNSKKWRAFIRANNKRIHLGLFDNPEDANRAYCDASIRLHGEFSNLG